MVFFLIIFFIFNKIPLLCSVTYHGTYYKQLYFQYRMSFVFSVDPASTASKEEKEDQISEIIPLWVRWSVTGRRPCPTGRLSTFLPSLGI